MHDGPISDALVGVYFGTAETPVASVRSDDQGGYEVDISYTDDDSDKQVVIKAQRGTAALVTVAGSVDTVTAAANDGVVTATTRPDINVTNVSTAVFAIIKREGATDPAAMGDTELRAIKDEIRNSTAMQTEVLTIAAGIKAVIDYGAALDVAGSEIRDTLALAEKMATNSTGGETILAALAADADVEPAAMIAEVESDPVVSVQLPRPLITIADIEGKRFAVGEDTLLVFSADGSVTMYDYGSITGAEPPDMATWSFDESSQTLTLTADTTYVAQFQGGSVETAIPITMMANGASEELVLYRALSADLSSVPKLTFNPLQATMRFQPDACDGEPTGLHADGASNGPLACQVVNGVFLYRGSTLPEPGTGAYPDEGTYAVVVPLAGSTATRRHVARWFVDAEGERATRYIWSYAPTDKPLPNNSGALRITSTGVVSLSFAHDELTGCTTDAIRGCVKVYQLASSGDVMEVLNDVAVTRMLGFDYMLAERTGNTNAVFRLHGSTPGKHQEGIVTQVMVNDFDSGDISHTESSRVITRSVYPFTDSEAADVAGKTFSLIARAGNDQDIGTITFAADGSYDEGSCPGTWTIGDHPQFPVSTVHMIQHETEDCGGDIFLFRTAEDLGDKAVFGLLDFADGLSEPVTGVGYVTVTQQ